MIEGKYAASIMGRSMIRAEIMVCIYFVQLWYQLADSEIEETLFLQIVRDFTQSHQSIDLIPRIIRDSSIQTYINSSNNQSSQ